MDCGTSVVSVSWNGSAAGTLYTATALGSDGQRHDCTGRAGCSLSTLGCATEYNVSITPARGACMGSQSPTQLVRTGKDPNANANPNANPLPIMSNKLTLDPQFASFSP